MPLYYKIANIIGLFVFCHFSVSWSFRAAYLGRQSQLNVMDSAPAYLVRSSANHHIIRRRLVRTEHP